MTSSETIYGSRHWVRPLGVAKPGSLNRPRYYRRRLWKISNQVIRIAPSRWRVAKFYERREMIGFPWKLMHSAVYETTTAP